MEQVYLQVKKIDIYNWLYQQILSIGDFNAKIEVETLQ